VAVGDPIYPRVRGGVTVVTGRYTPSQRASLPEDLPDEQPRTRRAKVRHWITAGTTVIALAIAVGTANAAPPLRDRFEVDATFPADELTEACGVPITVHFTGTFSVAVLGDREIDTQPGTKLTYANEAGDSIAFPFSAVLHATYPEGIAVGAPAVITLTGNGGAFGGAMAGTGRLVFSAVIVETEDGFAFTRFTGLLSQKGNFTSQTERICDALA
jgi:hypothetical protein